MRVVACLGLLALCLGPVGCSGLGKKTSLPKSGDDHAPAAAPRDGRAPARADASGDTGGSIYGTVVDGFNNTPKADVYIAADDGKPVPVWQKAETDGQGHFQAFHLQPGQPYRVVAVARDGSIVEGGEAKVRPPNAKVVVLLRRDYVPNVPQDAPAGGKESPASLGQPVPIGSSAPGDRKPAVDMGAPVPATATPAPGFGAGQAVPIGSDFVGPATDPRKGRESPRVDLPGPFAPKPPQPRYTPPSSRPAPPSGGPALPDPPLSPLGSTPLPSCDLRGERLYNFALAGLDRQPWEYKDHRGKVVLLDFWGTWCAPCRATVRTNLVPLNALYGRQGLEIVGVAYENENTFDGQAATVSRSVRDLGISYRVLLGCGRDCPVAKDFGVKGYPTLVLLDEKGQIIWRHVGGLSDAEFLKLKAIIRGELGIR